MEKIEAPVNEFIDNPVNSQKLGRVANDAKVKFPERGAEYLHLQKFIEKKEKRIKICLP